ncbi:MAG: hypothetical protein AAF242_10250 [Bacteroidota bacterium]
MNLIETKEWIRSYKVNHCGLFHEEVLLDPKTNRPLFTGSLENPIYKRTNLCDSTTRKKTLGCAHSSANMTFDQLMDDLPKEDPIFSLQRDQLQETFFQIHMIDHKKGNLEKDVADCLNSEIIAKQRLEEVRAAIEICKKEHSQLLDQLAGLQSKILERIDELIASNLFSM